MLPTFEEPEEGAAPIEDPASELKAMSATVEIVEARLKKAALAMVRMQEGVAGSGEVAEQVGSLYNDLKELSEKLKGLGVGPAGLVDLAENRSGDFDYLRNVVVAAFIGTGAGALAELGLESWLAGADVLASRLTLTLGTLGTFGVVYLAVSKMIGTLPSGGLRPWRDGAS